MSININKTRMIIDDRKGDRERERERTDKEVRVGR